MNFLKSLDSYIDSLASKTANDDQWFSHQTSMAMRSRQFYLNEPTCFERENTFGHFTGSSLVVDPEANKLVLVHHKKYDKWLQPGEHCDGIKDPFFTAWQEAYQETGLKDIRPCNPWSIVDIAIDTVPAYGEVCEHLHYDIRYVFEASSQDEIIVSDESHDVRWVALNMVHRFSSEPDLMRLVEGYFEKKYI